MRISLYVACISMIWLLRHGDAAGRLADAERQLTDKGREQARAAGAALRRSESS